MMEFIFIHVIKRDAPNTKEELADEASHEKKIQVEVNSEKILLATIQIEAFVSEKIGSPDEIGAVMVLKNHGLKNVDRFPGVELWLEILQKKYSLKSTYLIGGKKEVIQELVTKFKRNYPEIRIR
jgi:UDP-N-acetyl-D-mannosaminuronic acid transferase (WecB/TagA/CpsF family)